jgi:hypothetical protein
VVNLLIAQGRRSSQALILACSSTWLKGLGR